MEKLKKTFICVIFPYALRKKEENMRESIFKFRAPANRLRRFSSGSALFAPWLLNKKLRSSDVPTSDSRAVAFLSKLPLLSTYFPKKENQPQHLFVQPQVASKLATGNTMHLRRRIR